jgi:hypothetical protein
LPGFASAQRCKRSPFFCKAKKKRCAFFAKQKIRFLFFAFFALQKISKKSKAKKKAESKKEGGGLCHPFCRGFAQANRATSHRKAKKAPQSVFFCFAKKMGYATFFKVM